MNPVVALLAGALIVLVITVATGYFVAQEFAYMAVDRSRLKARADSGDPAAARALAVTRRTSFMLSGAQLGITVTGLLVGYVAEPLIGGSLSTLFGGIGIPSAVSIGLGALLALLFSTVIQMLFGELFPKNLAIARPEPLALGLATSTTIYLKVMGLLIRFFDQSSNLLLRALRIEPVHDVEHSASARDLEHIVADSRESGDLPDELSMMLDRILDFPSRDVEHAMIPRARVGTVSAADPIGHVRDLMSTGHSRYPVLADRDEIQGVVHLADLLATDLSPETPVTAIQRDALVIPTLMALPDALNRLGETSNQMACVVDEYGGFAGVLTLEDLAEELVGEITDEHDVDQGLADPVHAHGTWDMAGDVHIDELERALDVGVPRGDYETVSGLVIAQFGGLPPAGTVVTVGTLPEPGAALTEGVRTAPVLHIEVVEIRSHVPAKVRLTLEQGDVPSPQPDPGSDREPTDPDADGATSAPTSGVPEGRQRP